MVTFVSTDLTLVIRDYLSKVPETVTVSNSPYLTLKMSLSIVKGPPFYFLKDLVIFKS